MRRNLFLFLVIVIFNLLALSISYGKTEEQRIYRVLRVVDGDTIKLNNGETVRLIGIDTPELKNSTKLQKDIKVLHLTKSAELAMGRRSYQFTKRLVEGKKVYLKFDRKKYDQYERVLAYVYLANGSFVNAEILKNGYAYVEMIKPDLQYSGLFRKLYKEARDNHRGLWKEKTTSKKHLKWFKKS